MALALRQGTPEWLEGRRALITGTDIPVLLGLSPYRCEADLADEKQGGEPQPSSLRMRIGKALEPLILAEYEEATGRRTRRAHAMVRHPSIEWAAASLDAEVVGERRIVELKRNDSPSRFVDGEVPRDVEAQVQWQLGVRGAPVADVAVLGRDRFEVFEIEADPATFDNLVTVAIDFRRRLDEGGPFARDAARVRRDHPADDGSEIAADGDLIEAVRALLDTRASRKRLEENEEALETAIKTRMADAALLTGPGFRVTWKRTKDRAETDWKSMAAGLLNTLPETEREALVGLHTTVRPGFRPFRVVTED